MSKIEKLLSTVLHGQADSNIHFDDLCTVMKNLGFEERIKGSHHIFQEMMQRKLLIFSLNTLKIKTIR
jgi:predicted RNA binding protein YcfA (HicA-like mRNA interferase family)